MKNNIWYVYILKGDRYYVGYTGDLEKRMQEHAAGGTKTTREMKIHPMLVGYFTCETKTQAISLERRIKKSKNTKRRVDYEGFVRA